MRLTRRTGEPSTGGRTWVNDHCPRSCKSRHRPNEFQAPVPSSTLVSAPPVSSISGHLEVVKLLVASGAEVDCKDKKAYTPLHAAASSGMSSTVHYLLSLGVNVSTHTHMHEPAPYIAVGSPLSDNLLSLKKVNEVNAYGNTPLHLACYNGQDVVVSELIQAGAKVNQVCLCAWPGRLTQYPCENCC